MRMMAMEIRQMMYPATKARMTSTAEIAVHTRSMIRALAMPPPSHMVCSP